MIEKYHLPRILLCLLAVAMSACTLDGGAPQMTEGPSSSGRLEVLATTTILGDVVSQVTGEAVRMSVLLPPGIDPHAYEPTPQDVAKMAEADVIFANGVGLESALEPTFESAGAGEKVVYVSRGIDLLQSAGTGVGEAESGDHPAEMGDPHVWTDPNNVIIWVENITAELSELDPTNADVYASNAQAYRQELESLDAWIVDLVSQIRRADREIVTDHLVFSYFAEVYGFEQVGAIVPGYSTLAEPSARELAQLEDTIRDLGVKAVFVGNTVNPNLAERVAEDTGTQLVFLYTGSLTEEGGEVDTYLEYIRYNVHAIVDALK